MNPDDRDLDGFPSNPTGTSPRSHRRRARLARRKRRRGPFRLVAPSPAPAGVPSVLSRLGGWLLLLAFLASSFRTVASIARSGHGRSALLAATLAVVAALAFVGLSELLSRRSATR